MGVGLGVGLALLPHFYRDMCPWEWMPGAMGVAVMHCMSLHWLSLIASKVWKMQRKE